MRERAIGVEIVERRRAVRKLYNSRVHAFVKSFGPTNLFLSSYLILTPPVKIDVTPPPHVFQNTKSQPTSVMHSPTVAQNTTRATLPRSAARFNSRLPPPTFSAALSESVTSCCTCADWRSRFCASVVCREEMSRREDCTVLE